MENLKESMQSSVKYWWTGLLVGIVAIALGFWSFVTPVSTLVALNIIFIAGFLVSGVVDVVNSLSTRNSSYWGLLLASGLINLLIAFLLMSSPIESFEVLLFFVGFWVMFHSITTISMAISMHRGKIKGWGSLLFFGILGVLLSFVLIANFGFASGFLITLFSLALFVYGVTRISHAFALRRLKKNM